MGARLFDEQMSITQLEAEMSVAMDVKVEHRAHDLDMVVAYTWSKELDTKSSVGSIGGDDAGWAGPQDGHNTSSDYGRGNFDIRQRLAVSAVYPLPIGKGKALLGDSSSLVDEAIGGCTR